MVFDPDMLHLSLLNSERFREVDALLSMWTHHDSWNYRAVRKWIRSDQKSLGKHVLLFTPSYLYSLTVPNGATPPHHHPNPNPWRNYTTVLSHIHAPCCFWYVYLGQCGFRRLLNFALTRKSAVIDKQVMIMIKFWLWALIIIPVLEEHCLIYKGSSRVTPNWIRQLNQTGAKQLPVCVTCMSQFAGECYQ